jgi:hypothetical protein
LKCEIAAPVNQAKLLRIREQQEQTEINRRLCFMYYQDPKLQECLKDAERPDFH